jgi:hypothetical protein
LGGIGGRDHAIRHLESRARRKGLLEMGNLGSKGTKGSGKRLFQELARSNVGGKGIPEAAYHSDRYEKNEQKRQHYYKSWIAGSLIISHGAIDYPVPPKEMAKMTEDMITEAANIAIGLSHDVTIVPPNKSSNAWKLLIVSGEDGLSSEHSYSAFSIEDLVTWSIKWLNSKK